MKKTIFCAAFAFAALLHAENIVRNGGFDFAKMFNGSKMIIGYYDDGQSIYESQAAKLWRSLPFEAWWINADAQTDCQAKAMDGFIRLQGKHYKLCSSPTPKVSTKMVASFDVRTKNASAKADFIAYNSETQKKHWVRGRLGSKTVDLPKDTAGKWQRITIPYDGIPGDDIGINFEFESGEVDIDNVQIENGLTATPFELAVNETFEFTLGKFTAEKLPRYYTKRTKEEKLSVKNMSRKPVSGTLTVYLDTWDKAGSTVLKEFKLKNLKPGGTVSCMIDVGKLEPEGYVLVSEFKNESGKVLLKKEIYEPKNTGAGTRGKSQMLARNGLRFAVFPDIAPKDLFGVANGMVGVPSNNFFTGAEMADFAEAKTLHYSGFTGNDTEASFFHYAVGGAQAYINDWIDQTGEHKNLANPASKNNLDFHNPEAYKIIMKRAGEKGKYFAEGPGPAGYKMRNESPYLADGATCPTPAADAAFRQYCKDRYKTLDALNKAWHKNYKDWNEVEQIVSAKMAGENTTVKKEGAAAIDWMAHMGTMTPEVGELMRKDPGRAMDWCRWRSKSSLKVYLDYRKELKKYAPDTVVGVNQPWPNFWPQIFIPMWRDTDAAMLDQQYAASAGKDLGSSDEMIDMLEMAESTSYGRPLWGIEIYVQPSFPDDFPALQNWGMLAHGMSQNLVFAWRPYSDHGASVFKDGPGAWKKKDSVPMWMFIDTDGTKLPIFDSNQKSLLEIEEFHKKYNALSLKRMKSRTGYYLPDDSAELVIMWSRNRPFGGLTGTRVTIGAQMRFAGATLTYMDDVALQEADNTKFDTIIVPPSPVMTDEAIDKLYEFAKNGGQVVFLGACGVYDPCMNLRTEFANGKFGKGWKIPESWAEYPEYEKCIVAFNKEKEMREMQKLTPPPKSKPVRFGNKVYGNTVQIGKGRFFSMRVWPARYHGHQASLAFREYIANLIKCLKIPTPALWKTEDTPERRGDTLRAGTGAPYVEVVIREKSEKERFLFVLNQGGAGNGNVQLTEEWKIEDVLTGKKYPFGKTIPITKLQPLEYRIFRLTR